MEHILGISRIYRAYLEYIVNVVTLVVESGYIGGHIVGYIKNVSCISDISRML